MNIAVYGAGYVGTITAACFAKLGHCVWLVEASEEKLRVLRAGECPVIEPGLSELLRPLLSAGRVIPVALVSDAAEHADVSMICVGTPSLSDGRPDARQVKKVVQEIAGVLAVNSRPHVIVIRSTLPYPVITSEILPILKSAIGERFGREVSFALNPEFLREGSAIRDFFEPPLVVAGTDHEHAATVLRQLYEPSQAPFCLVAPGSASLLKYACNAFHAAKVVFANEIASLGKLFCADPVEVMDLFCRDRILNISGAYLRPGYAYGGSCLPKDLNALTQLAQANGVSTPLLHAIPRSNQALIDSTIHVLDHSSYKRVVLIGLSFKNGVDDLRESPYVELAERLLGKGYDISIYDPHVDTEKLVGRNLQFAQRHLQHLAKIMVSDLSKVAAQADLIIFGKQVIPVVALSEIVPPETPILDLTRALPKGSAKLSVFHLEGNSTALPQESGVH